MEFAVIHTGGKQYKVAVGDVVSIEKLPGEFTFGDKIVFDTVVLLDNGKDTKIGAPYVSGAKVEALFQETAKEPRFLFRNTKQRVVTSNAMATDNLLRK